MTKQNTASTTPEELLSLAASMREEVGTEFHDRLIESIYTDAAQIADHAVTRRGASILTARLTAW